MTTVRIYRKNGKIIRYRSYRHSGYNIIGNDIVCAALSIILQTPLGGMQDVLQIDPQYIMGDDGYLDVNMENVSNKDKMKEADILLETMFVMLKELKKEYPKNLKLVEKEVK
ncbi:MAG: ribosomal-processing cysteine protease Prp [Fusobacteriaceae bacterium]|jgi:uncharacterized protein YsxB (DUF464 family)|nr:ribosomal-processing cysteine protease Prp [Fusobacteriaceae bacterium]